MSRFSSPPITQQPQNKSIVNYNDDNEDWTKTTVFREPSTNDSCKGFDKSYVREQKQTMVPSHFNNKNIKSSPTQPLDLLELADRRIKRFQPMRNIDTQSKKQKLDDNRTVVLTEPSQSNKTPASLPMQEHQQQRPHNSKMPQITKTITTSTKKYKPVPIHSSNNVIHNGSSNQQNTPATGGVNSSVLNNKATKNEPINRGSQTVSNGSQTTDIKCKTTSCGSQTVNDLTSFEDIIQTINNINKTVQRLEESKSPSSHAPTRKISLSRSTISSNNIDMTNETTPKPTIHQSPLKHLTTATIKTANCIYSLQIDSPNTSSELQQVVKVGMPMLVYISPVQSQDTLVPVSILATQNNDTSDVLYSIFAPLNDQQLNICNSISTILIQTFSQNQTSCNIYCASSI